MFRAIPLQKNVATGGVSVGASVKNPTTIYSITVNEDPLYFHAEEFKRCQDAPAGSPPFSACGGDHIPSRTPWDYECSGSYQVGFGISCYSIHRYYSVEKYSAGWGSGFNNGACQTVTNLVVPNPYNYAECGGKKLQASGSVSVTSNVSINWNEARISTYTYTGSKVFTYTNDYGLKSSLLVDCTYGGATHDASGNLEANTGTGGCLANPF